MMKLEIQGVHMDVDAKLQAYVTKKIGKLDRYVPKSSRESLHAQVFLKEEKKSSKKSNICEVVMKLPQETLTTKEATVNMYAAVDIVETKLKNRLKKYKETHNHKRLHQRVLSRLKRRSTV